MRLSLEIDPHTAARLNEAAQNTGISPSEWIVRLIERSTIPEWPTSVKSLVGAWRGEPWPEEDGRATRGQDVPREPF
ncbi:MAG: CopG family transcriptional regulator [Candidatus Competibacter sp.]|nr:CopG family transcriptional regulator [Candidatus Competibacter sp.]